MAKIHRALISVSNKTGIVDFAQSLVELGIFILATGGTARLLEDHRIPVREVSELTGFPDLLDGRVKTLHPTVHAGLLGRPQDQAVLAQHHIDYIDLVVCNLYPFSTIIAQDNTTLKEAIEHIDIGGPTLLRAGAKNHERVTVLSDPNDYSMVLEEIKTHHHSTMPDTRLTLAQKAFALTAEYDAHIATYFSKQKKLQEGLPETWQIPVTKIFDLRYGENPQQQAALYRTTTASSQNGIAHAELLQGKPLSFNNLIDADAAFRCVSCFDPTLPSCVIIKHATPCGAASAEDLQDAYEKAWACDKQSAFGGIIAFNQTVDTQTLANLLTRQFAEVVVAPQFEPEALIVAKSKPLLRLLQANPEEESGLLLRSLSGGGVLIQTEDTERLKSDKLQIVTTRQPTEREMQDALFAWQVVKQVKSNAIVYAKNGQTLGIGSGQTSRVFSAEIGLLKAKAAGFSLEGAVMASDAFFPFADGIEAAIQAGVTTIIQSGGSKRDLDVITAANAAGITMILTGIRHFCH